jgi:streptomycin 6-kinase
LASAASTTPTSSPTRNSRRSPIPLGYDAISAAANIEPARLLRWIAAYCGLSAAWFLDDGMSSEAQSPLTVARIALAELNQG